MAQIAIWDGSAWVYVPVTLNAILKDGSVDFTANQSMNSNKLTSLSDGTGVADAINLAQLFRRTISWTILAMATAISKSTATVDTYIDVQVDQAASHIQVLNTESRVSRSQIRINGRAQGASVTGGTIGLFDTSNNLIAEAAVGTTYGPVVGTYSNHTDITSDTRLKVRVKTAGNAGTVDILAVSLEMDGT